MERLSKSDLLGLNDLKEKEVVLPSLGGKTVKVRALPAAFSNQASSESLKMVVDSRGEQTSQVDMNKLEVLKVFHGLVDPKLDSVQEAEELATRIGPAWEEIVKAITDLSGIDEEAIKQKAEQFQVREPVQNGGAPAQSETADAPRGS